jgi:hypothetical protein
MQQITQKIAQKVKVDNLVRNLKTTELEKFSLNKQHWVYIQKVVDDTKREINSSVQLQLYKEVLEILKNTMKNYRTNLGKDHAITTDIQERIYYIEDILASQYLLDDRSTNWLDKVTKIKNRVSHTMDHGRHSTLGIQKSKLSVFSFMGDTFTSENTADQNVGSFRKSYVATHLSPNMYVTITVIAIVTIIAAYTFAA